MEFKKSSRCGTSTCVEVAIGHQDIWVGDSKNPDAAPLKFTRAEWTDFVAGVKLGEFDIK
jgi:hypothetical protein